MIKLGTRFFLEGTIELQRRLSNPRTAMQEVALYMERQTKQRFVQQTDPGGQAWQPLSPATLRQRRDGRAQALLKTGTLFASFIPYSDEKQARISTSVPHARFHNDGTSRIPQRRFMGAGEPDAAAIGQILMKYFDVEG